MARAGTAIGSRSRRRTVASRGENMPIVTIPLAEIVDLGTQVATTGAIRVAEASGDQVFEYIIAVAMLVYEMYPN